MELLRLVHARSKLQDVLTLLPIAGLNPMYCYHRTYGAVQFTLFCDLTLSAEPYHLEHVLVAL